MPYAMQRIEFSLEGRPHIELIKLLKAAGVVRSGGQAQMVVEQGLVQRNGLPELRKRTKVAPGEEIRYDCYLILVRP